MPFSQEVACSADSQLHAPHWPEANKPHSNRLSHANREDGMCKDILVDKVVLMCFLEKKDQVAFKWYHLLVRFSLFRPMRHFHIRLDPILGFCEKGGSIARRILRFVMMSLVYRTKHHKTDLCTINHLGDSRIVPNFPQWRLFKRTRQRKEFKQRVECIGSMV